MKVLDVTLNIALFVLVVAAALAGCAHAAEPAWQAYGEHNRASGATWCVVGHVVPGPAITVVRGTKAVGSSIELFTINTDQDRVRGTIYAAVGDQRFSGQGGIPLTPELLTALRDGDRLSVGWSSLGESYQEVDVPLAGFAATYDQCTAILERLQREAGRE